MLRVLLALSLLLGSFWEKEPNDEAPCQFIPFPQMSLHGSLSSSTDVDRYGAGLGLPFPFVTQWLTRIKVVGETGKKLELEIWQKHFWYSRRELVCRKSGWGELDVQFLFAHHPWQLWGQEIILRGEAQEYTIRGVPFNFD